MANIEPILDFVSSKILHLRNNKTKIISNIRGLDARIKIIQDRKFQKIKEQKYEEAAVLRYEEKELSKQLDSAIGSLNGSGWRFQAILY